MGKFIITLLTLILFSNPILAESQVASAENLFHIGQMRSHDKNFSLYFKTREKAVLARGETFNYITDYPQDLYMYNYKTKASSPLITYEWFPSEAKYMLEEYDFPVFPEDFAYYFTDKQSFASSLNEIKEAIKN